MPRIFSWIRSIITWHIAETLPKRCLFCPEEATQKVLKENGKWIDLCRNCTGIFKGKDAVITTAEQKG